MCKNTKSVKTICKDMIPENVASNNSIDPFEGHKELEFYTKTYAAVAIPTKSKDRKGEYVRELIEEFQPKDASEARLCCIMGAAYAWGMHCLGEAYVTELRDLSESRLNLGMKLLRLHNETFQTLSSHRRGGEQKVVVQHQHVNIENGAQAIVGNVQSGGGGVTSGNLGG